MFTALTSLPTSPPVQLGGTTPAFLNSNSVLLALARTQNFDAGLSLITWAEEHQAWIVYPVDELQLQLAVNNGFGAQRYVCANTPDPQYFSFYRSSGQGTITIQVKKGN